MVIAWSRRMILIACQVWVYVLSPDSDWRESKSARVRHKGRWFNELVVDCLCVSRTGNAFGRSSDPTYYPIGGVIAAAISDPSGSQTCEQTGSCGVPGLVAVVQSSRGSAANAQAIQSGALESAFVQSDVVYWAYSGTGDDRIGGAAPRLRTIASLYRESVHLVVRRDSGIDAVTDLRGKRVSLDEPGSGTLTDALIILDAYGLSVSDMEAGYTKPYLASIKMADGQLDAFFFVAGYPAHSISELAMKVDIKLVPLKGAEMAELIERHRFFSRSVIPAGIYDPARNRM
ncbi:MAG: TAXI family TRAP transporter solute-binding subunit [Gammaproteobacteria bacterium]|nr:TAXI family TRAP transporter solute-binding subunit [Gammaproteobacteria bacterium]